MLRTANIETCHWILLSLPHIPWQDCLPSVAEGTEEDFNITGGVASSRRMQGTFHQHESGKGLENYRKLNETSDKNITILQS